VKGSLVGSRDAHHSSLPPPGEMPANRRLQVTARFCHWFMLDTQGAPGRTRPTSSATGVVARMRSGLVKPAGANLLAKSGQRRSIRHGLKL